jgi:hypothetical protein
MAKFLTERHEWIPVARPYPYSLRNNLFTCYLVVFYTYLKMAQFDNIERTKIIVQKRKVSYSTIFSFKVKLCLNVSFLKVEYVLV